MAEDLDPELDAEALELDEEIDELDEDLGGDDLVDDPLDEDDDALVDDEALEGDDAEEEPVLVAKVTDEVEDLEQLSDDDVEASLDEILKERLVVEDEPEDDEVVDEADRGEVERVLPKQPDEFVCSSCFLVKHPSQLADKKKKLCRDCV